MIQIKSTETILCEHIQQYIKAKKGKDVPIEEIRKRPYHELVGLYWDAIAYLKLGEWYISLDQAEPEEGKFIFVRQRLGNYKQCVYRKGEWKEVSEIDQSIYKM